MKKFLLCMSLCAIACCISKLSADDAVVELKEGVSPHDDSGADFTCSCYLNKEDKNSDKVAHFKTYRAPDFAKKPFKHKLKSLSPSQSELDSISISVTAKPDNVQLAFNDKLKSDDFKSDLSRVAGRVFKCKQHCEKYLGEECFFGFKPWFT